MRIKIYISKEVTFDDTCIGMKCKNFEVKELETIVEKTRFALEVPTSETRDEEELVAHTSNAGQGATYSGFKLSVGT